jgi:hypothetical protein
MCQLVDFFSVKFHSNAESMVTYELYKGKQ